MRTPAFAFMLVLAACVNAPAQESVYIMVNVLGEVNKPTRCTLTPHATVLDALASAGDATKDADLKHVKVIHPTTTGKPEVATIDIKAALDGTTVASELRDGDTMVIPKRVVAVMQ